MYGSSAAYFVSWNKTSGTEGLGQKVQVPFVLWSLIKGRLGETSRTWTSFQSVDTSNAKFSFLLTGWCSANLEICWNTAVKLSELI